MKQHVTLQDLGDQDVLFDGMADCTPTESGGWVIEMKAGQQEYVWKILKHGLILRSISSKEVWVQIVLKKQGASKAMVHEGLHQLELPVQLLSMEEKEQKTWKVSYCIEDAGQTFSFELKMNQPLETDTDMR